MSASSSLHSSEKQTQMNISLWYISHLETLQAQNII